MKLHSDSSDSGHTCSSGPHAVQDMNLNHRLTLTSDCLEALCNGSSDQSELEKLTSHCDKSEDEDDLTPEVQQAHRIFQSFLSEKHKSTTAPFWRPIGPGAQMSFRRMDDKFVNREYESITPFVADFRLMLENCYRFHGVDHWISKQAQKLEVILEQKLTLLPRTLREKTTLAVTSRGRFGTEDERAPGGSSSRRRSVPRSLASITVGGSESVMVQALRLEELQKARDHKRQREQERKEAEEASVKELEDWEASLLSLAEPCPITTMWELPAIGHFLCLAQRALNLPEIVFYELERCLLMPRCSVFLARLMTSLLCHPLKRPNVHRRPPLPYRRWETELRRRVQAWYRAVGRAEERAAERLGLCHQFFWTLGEVSPLEETPFHLLAFKQRVWLLKGLCDHVYETQKDVQDAVLGQPIHECRESILGYDEQENAYIHFPHFCGADLRIYCQSPCGAVQFPLPPLTVRRTLEEEDHETDEEKVETESSSRTEVNSWEDLDQKGSSGREESLDFRSSCGKFVDERGLKDEDESDCEPCFRVGESIPAALNGHRSPKREVSGSCLCPENTCLREDELTDTTLRTKKRRRKTEGRFGMKKTSKLSLKRRRMSLQRSAASFRRRRMERRRKHAGRQTDGKMTLVRRDSGSALLPAEPTFQLVCSSLDDLRVLISKTEDQLDELDDGQKRSGRLPQKRAAVKELHITLIRLLNELLPWEPKLVKAFQRNRARLKKEFDDFKKHPEYEHFIRERMDTVDSGEVTSTETTRELDDEAKISRTMKEYSEGAENVNELGSHVMHSSESGPFTRSSKRRLSEAMSDEMSLCKKGKVELEYNVDVGSREQTTVSVLPEPMSSFQGTCKPIQALLAKSVGNKVTLISHPKAAVMAQIAHSQVPPVRLLTTCPPTSQPTTESTGQVVYTTAGGVGLLSKGSKCSASDGKSGEKLQQVVILPSNLLIQSTENKAAKTSKNTTYLSNASGFTIPENKVPVQQVAPLKDTITVKTPSAIVAPSLRTVGVPKQTTEPSSGLTNPDAREELRTVCIRDSQSILVTTRGGNTGVVKVQTSESGAGALPPNPAFTISPQLQAFLVSKSSTSTTQSILAKSLPAITPQSLPKSGVQPSSSVYVAGTLNNTSVNKPSTLVSSQISENVFFKCAMKPPQKSTPDQTTFQKVFLVNPAATTATCTKPASQVVSLSKSALTIPKGTSTSVVNICTPALKVIPKLGTTLSCSSSGTSVLNIGVTGLTSRILGANKSPEASTKSTPGVVSTVSTASTSSGLQVIPKSSLVAGASSLKVPGTVDCKMLTFSTLGTGHMASSALLSVVKQDVPSSVTPLNAFHCKPGSTSGSSTSLYSGSLNSKHTTVPIDVTTNKQVTTSTSLSPVKTTANTSTSGVSRTASTFPAVMTSGIRPPASTNKSVQERVVINTTAPLAPGTQLLINNTRFVVPSQGLGPGTHVLLISSGPGGLQVPSPVHPGGLQVQSPAHPGGLQVSSPVHPGGLQVSSPVHPGGLQVQSPAHPGGLQVSSPVHPGGLQVSSPVHPGGLQVQSPVHPGGLQVSSPVHPGGLQVQSPVHPGGLQVPSSAHPGGLQVPSPPHLGGLQVPSPARLGGLQVQSPAHPCGLQVQSPVHPRGFQVPSPSHLGGLQVPRTVHPGKLQGSTPVRPAGLQVPNPASTVPRGSNSLTPYTVPSVVQGVRLVTPVRLPSPIAGPSDRVYQQTSTRTPLKVVGPIALSQTAQSLRPGVSSDIVRLPIFQASKVSVAPSQGTTGIPKDTFLSTTSPILLQGRSSQNQLATIVRNSPVVTVPPMKSTVSRMQKLPVATVQPIGGPTNTSSATPIATVPPSVNTVIMTPCPPGTVGKPVILPQLPQGQSTVPVQVPTSSKLLLSPDGAVLNIIQASSVVAQVISSTSSSVTNFTHK